MGVHEGVERGPTYPLEARWLRTLHGAKLGKRFRREGDASVFCPGKTSKEFSRGDPCGHCRIWPRREFKSPLMFTRRQNHALHHLHLDCGLCRARFVPKGEIAVGSWERKRSLLGRGKGSRKLKKIREVGKRSWGGD
jgi:hypothetical protein